MQKSTTTSIAGRAHGAKPKTNKQQTSQYYPPLDGNPDVHPEVARGIRTAFDNIYELRSQVQGMSAGGTSASSSGSGGGAAAAGGGDGGGSSAAYGTGILGIQYKAATDPASLQHGANTTYNSQTGQFEFSTPAGFVPAPTSATSTGVKGQITHDDSFVYICTGTNTWMRAPIATWM
jgi:hypothetical protein